ncbi:MAG: MopE-related protein, partial [bacterium]|nr:MopE-related protein [bacterium]
MPSGFTVVSNPLDCNDSVGSIYPGAPLNCDNGMDNDCSGHVERWYYEDQDRDSWTTAVIQCANVMPSGFTVVSNPLDCNDSDALINPGVPDNTCDSVDNNCNLYVDESTAPCFSPSITLASWGLTGVVISWVYPGPSSNVENFVVERSSNGITFYRVSVLPGNVTSFFNKVYLNSRYHYRVYARNATGVGGFSNLITLPTSLFEKTLGGSLADSARSIARTSDGGYIVAGSTQSFGAGSGDFYVAKFDRTGVVQWTRTFGGSTADEARSIIQTSDGGYIVVGHTYSLINGSDIYVIKLGSSGNVQWTRTVGGSDDDFGNYVIQVSGGYVIAGNTYSFGATFSDVYVVMLSSSGSVQWTITIGGSGNDIGKSVIQTSDGGFLVVGDTAGQGGSDILVVKLYSSGATQWIKTIDVFFSSDFANSVIQSPDGGFVIAGYTVYSVDKDIYIVKLNSDGSIHWTRRIGNSQNSEYGEAIINSGDGGYFVVGSMSHGVYSDIVVARLNSSGDLLWSKTIGGTNNDYAYSVTHGSDGGYVLVGSTNSFGAGDQDIYLVKIADEGTLECHDQSYFPGTGTGGTEQFQTLVSAFPTPLSASLTPISYTVSSTDYALCVQNFAVAIGGTNFDRGNSVIQTLDEGYLVVGSTSSFGAGNYDVYIVKLNSSGAVQWTRTVGGSGSDSGGSVIQTSDGGYLIVGETSSFVVGGSDVFIVKLDSSGAVQWTRTVGGTNSDEGKSVIQTADGGYLIVGDTVGPGNVDVLVVKTDSSGDVQWLRRVGGSNYDRGESVVQSSDGGYIVVGHTSSFGAGGDIYVVKLDSSGLVQWNKTMGGSDLDFGSSVIQSSDGGYVVIGGTYSFGSGWDDIYVAKVGSAFENCFVQGVTNYTVFSPVTSSVLQSPSSSSPSPASYTFSVTPSSGGSLIPICYSAGAPPLPMCYVNRDCDFPSFDRSFVVENNQALKDNTTRISGQNTESYGCSASAFTLVVVYLIFSAAVLRAFRYTKR